MIKFVIIALIIAFPAYAIEAFAFTVNTAHNIVASII